MIKQRDNIGSWVTLAAIVLLAAVLRFWDLDRTSIWFDEAVSWLQSRESFINVFVRTASDNYPPLHNLVLWPMIKLFGDSETVLRVPSAILGTLGVAMIYQLGADLWDRRTGLLAAFLLAVSPIHIWYSTEARMYALLSLCSIVFVWSLVRVCQRPGPFNCLLALAAGAAVLYTHIYSVFLFAALNILILFAYAYWPAMPGTGRRDWFLSQAAAFALFCPWLVVLFLRTRVVLREGFWLPYPNWSFLEGELVALAGSGGALLLLYAVSMLCFLPRLPALQNVKLFARVPTFSWQSVLVLTWTAAPLLTGYVLSILIQPIFHQRYLLGALPGFILLAAAGACAASRYLLPLATAALTIALTFGAVDNSVHVRERSNWRQATAVAKRLATPGDYVSFSLEWSKWGPGAYYLRDAKKTYRLVGFDEAKALQASAGERIWLFYAFAGPDMNFDQILPNWTIKQKWTFHSVTTLLLVPRK